MSTTMWNNMHVPGTELRMKREVVATLSSHRAYLGPQLHPDVHFLLHLLQDAQQVLLEHADASEEMLVVPAPLHVIKVHPESEQELHAAAIQGDLLRAAQQRGPVALIQHGQLQNLPRADSDQGGRQSHRSRTHDEHRDPGPPLPDRVQAPFKRHVHDHRHQSAEDRVTGECAVPLLRVLPGVTKSSVSIPHTAGTGGGRGGPGTSPNSQNHPR